MKSKYVFPCVIHQDKDDKVFYVRFPDLDDCFTDGDNLDEAIFNAKDVLGLCLFEYEKLGREILAPSYLNFHLDEGEAVFLVEVWMPIVRDDIRNKSVNKTLSIPRWLNDDLEQFQVGQGKNKEYLNKY